MLLMLVLDEAPVYAPSAANDDVPADAYAAFDAGAGVGAEAASEASADAADADAGDADAADTDADAAGQFKSNLPFTTKVC